MHAFLVEEVSPLLQGLSEGDKSGTEGGREEGLKSFTFLFYFTLNVTKGDR